MSRLWWFALGVGVGAVGSVAMFGSAAEYWSGVLQTLGIEGVGLLAVFSVLVLASVSALLMGEGED